MIKDYIFAVTDLEAFRSSLLTSNSKLVNVSEDGIATIQSPTTMIKYNGNKSVAMSRIDESYLAEVLALGNITLCGSGVNVKTIDDVSWTDKALYHSIHNIETVTLTDEEGEHSYTPPLLHCVFA